MNRGQLEYISQCLPRYPRFLPLPLLTLTLFLATTHVFSADQKALRVEEGTATHVADGDTVTVITPNQTKLRIRLFGIDAPETPKGAKFPGQPYGNEAMLYLKHLVEGKRVKVEIFGTDRYRRLLATLFIDAQHINLAMVEAGLAEVYRGPESGNPYKAQSQAAEEAARRASRGMWVLGNRYESPRDYRRRVGISKPGSSQVW